ncbi:DUF6688 family protein [Parasediminibacterium sp. JCM 36343]|uniref:DUF6688 domain-containing protein n=1 Tax=Parasediminibacterium sp. JCM 36343 TaxID=3374279 RepID=UPI00397A8275
MAPLLLLISMLPVFHAVDFLVFLSKGKRMLGQDLAQVFEIISAAGLPVFFLMMDEKSNDCCGDSASFAPEHVLTIYVAVGICLAAFIYSSCKQNIKSPILETVTNALLLFGFMLNIFVAIQVSFPFILLGNLPVGLLFLLQLIKNHKQFLALHENSTVIFANQFEKNAWKILTLNPFIKMPLLLVLCIPILTIIACLLLLFGQKPDSIVKAFTDTYKHGFSQLDHLCDNVACGGHFLCSVAANGHTKVVKPIRYGERGGNKIICNRQLQVSNAFEELIEEKMPKAHRLIRHNYNRVGNMIHKHYHFFNNKYVSDFIFILMKPLELLFLLTLYTFDQKPENRIAKQYLNRMDKVALSGI